MSLKLFANDKVGKLTLVATGEAHSYGCLMVDLPSEFADKVVTWGKENIPNDVIYDTDDKEYGRESHIHTTVAYGIDPKTDPKDVQFALYQWKNPVKIKLGKISKFDQSAKGYDVIKIDVDSPDLHALRDSIEQNIGLPGNTFPDFKPHCTVAYVTPGSCDSLLGQSPFEGQEFELTKFDYSYPATEGAKDTHIKYDLANLKEADDKREHYNVVIPELQVNDITKAHSEAQALTQVLHKMYGKTPEARVKSREYLPNVSKYVTKVHKPERRVQHTPSDPLSFPSESELRDHFDDRTVSSTITDSGKAGVAVGSSVYEFQPDGSLHLENAVDKSSSVKRALEEPGEREFKPDLTDPAPTQNQKDSWYRRDVSEDTSQWPMRELSNGVTPIFKHELPQLYMAPQEVNWGVANGSMKRQAAPQPLKPLPTIHGKVTFLQAPTFDKVVESKDGKQVTYSYQAAAIEDKGKEAGEREWVVKFFVPYARGGGLTVPAVAAWPMDDKTVTNSQAFVYGSQMRNQIPASFFNTILNDVKTWIQKDMQAQKEKRQQEQEQEEKTQPPQSTKEQVPLYSPSDGTIQKVFKKLPFERKEYVTESKAFFEWLKKQGLDSDIFTIDSQRAGYEWENKEGPSGESTITIKKL